MLPTEGTFSNIEKYCAWPINAPTNHKIVDVMRAHAQSPAQFPGCVRGWLVYAYLPMALVFICLFGWSVGLLVGWFVGWLVGNSTIQRKVNGHLPRTSNEIRSKPDWTSNIERVFDRTSSEYDTLGIQTPWDAPERPIEQERPTGHGK